MKAKLPHPEHYSYMRHRKQRTTQIILPVVVAALLAFGMLSLLIVIATNGGGDVSRWAEISTIWLTIPVIVAGLIFLVILVALIYLMVLVMSYLPRYTGLAQDYVYLAQIYISRWADMAAKPIIALGGTFENIKTFFERIGTL
jgi:hypothetical protein